MYSSRQGTWNIGRTRGETRVTEKTQDNYGADSTQKLRDMEELGNFSNYLRVHQNSMRGGGMQLPQDDIEIQTNCKVGVVYPMSRDPQAIQSNG